MSEAVNQKTGALPELQFVPVDAITVDHNYQREIKPRRVQQILKEFHWSKFGALSLSRHPDGSLSVYDGQHRLAAARAHPRIDKVPAVIVDIDTMKDEAAAFLSVNIDRTAVTTIERYYAGIEAQDPDMIRVRDVLARAECEVVPAQGIGKRANRTQAITAVLRAIQRYGEKAVVQSCLTLVCAWPKDGDALAGTLITALSRLYRNNASIDEKRLVDCLRSRGRALLTADAETLRKIAGGSSDTVICKAIVENYNKGLSKNQIEIGRAASMKAESMKAAS